jgi:hypothetical protein
MLGRTVPGRYLDGIKTQAEEVVVGLLTKGDRSGLIVKPRFYWRILHLLSSKGYYAGNPDFINKIAMTTTALLGQAATQRGRTLRRRLFISGESTS